MTSAERSKALRHFTSSLWEYREMDVYWLPSRRRITCRQVNPECWNWDLPEDAIALGRYTQPYSAKTFVEDLCSLLLAKEKEAS